MKTAKEAKLAAERARERAVFQAEQQVSRQYDAVMMEVEKAADAGASSVEFRHHLKPEVIKLLRGNGFGVRDQGEGMADLYRIVWE